MNCASALWPGQLSLKTVTYNAMSSSNSLDKNQEIVKMEHVYVFTRYDTRPVQILLFCFHTHNSQILSN